MLRPRGFTLIELMVVLAIIGGLLSLAAPRYFKHVDRAKETVLKSDLASMRDAVDKFFADTGRYPANLEELVARRYLRKVPPDPITETSASWLVVAPADSALGGVYDVKSGASGLTLGGQPYGEL
jgi:general secretion pathway protein G